MLPRAVFRRQVSRQCLRSFCVLPLQLSNNSKRQTSDRNIFWKSYNCAERLHGTRRRNISDKLNLLRNLHKTVSVANGLLKKDLKKVTSDSGRRTIDIVWKNGESSSYPYLFLRDNCLCPDCFDSSSRHRLLLLQDLDLKCKPSSVEVSTCGDNINVIWDDGHKSLYPIAWLADHCSSEENRRKRSTLLGVTPELWGRDMTDVIPTFDFTRLIEDDVVLYKWIYALQKFGLALIQHAPTQTGQLSRIGDRISFLRRTNYGHTYDVFIKDNPSNAAYTDSALGCHTDLPYYNYSPGMQMLHCVEKTNVTGGDNILVDGFFAAEKLSQEDKSSFELLTTLKLDHEDIGQDHFKFHLLNRQPIFQLDDEGHYRRIAFSNFSRSTRHNIPVEMVEPMYQALKAFDATIYNPKNHIMYMLEEGEIICMNNQRVMHGRKSFKLEKDGGRQLEGGYIEWDDLLSKYRVLAAEIGTDI